MSHKKNYGSENEAYKYGKKASKNLTKIFFHQYVLSVKK